MHTLHRILHVMICRHPRVRFEVFAAPAMPQHLQYLRRVSANVVQSRSRAIAVHNSMILEYVPLLSQKRVVLASASPRRKDILSQLGLEFEARTPYVLLISALFQPFMYFRLSPAYKCVQVVVSNFDEKICKEGISACAYALETARQKALDVSRTISGAPPSLIIAADTVRNALLHSLAISSHFSYKRLGCVSL